MQSGIASTSKRSWQHVYQNFRELEQQLTNINDTTGHNFLPFLYAAAGGRKCLDDMLQERRSVCRTSTLHEPPDWLVVELGKIAVLQSICNTRSKEFVYEDVYHLAFHMLKDWRLANLKSNLSLNSCDSLYRGERKDTWGVQAKIYRDLPNNEERLSVLRDRAEHACRVGQAIANRRSLDFVKAMAVAQHYSPETKVPTWLLDFSLSPWVALFFASCGGEPEDFGIVWKIVPGEWTRHTAGKSNPIGGLQLITPPDIQRIDSQKGVFLIAGLPQIFDQYVAFGWETRFKQHCGVHFEDKMLDISKDTIFPPDDPLRETVKEFLTVAVDCPCKFGTQLCDIPLPVFADPVAPRTYTALLGAGFGHEQAERAATFDRSGLQKALTGLAQFHASLQSSAYVTRLPNKISRSLHRLRKGFELLCFRQPNGEPVLIQDAVEQSYVNHIHSCSDSDHVTVLREALREIAP